MLEKAFARSHRIFVEGTLKEPRILKWVSSHQHDVGRNMGVGFCFGVVLLMA